MQIIQRKICLVGSFAVGKSSLVRRFVEGRFSDNYLSTIGVKISRHVVELPSVHVKLLVWDLAGGEDLLHKNDSYLRGLSAALVVCDLTRAETVAVAIKYAHKIHTINEQAPIILLGNKSDLITERVIKDADLRLAATQINALTHFTTSAKTGEFVDLAFKTLAAEVVG